MATAPARQQPSPAAMYAAFRQNTQQNQYQQAPMLFSQFGQLVTMQLPQTGYLGNIWLNLTGTITTGAGTPAGAWASYPPLPWNLIKQIRVYTSEGVELFRCSGWGLFLLNMRKREVPNFAGDTVSYLNSTNRAALYSSVMAGATPAASTAYTFNAALKVPIMTDTQLMYGLINTQTNDVRVYMDITLCNQADTGNVSGVTLTPSFSIVPQVEFYLVPADAAAQPVLSYVHQVYEEFFPFNNTGNIVYRPTPGNIFLSLSGIIENNGAQVAASNINYLQLTYAQGVTPFNESYPAHLQRYKDQIGITPPDGYFGYMFDYASGSPYQLDSRDWLNTANQTDLQFVPNVSGITVSGGQLRCIKEQLARIG